MWIGAGGLWSARLHFPRAMLWGRTQEGFLQETRLQEASFLTKLGIWFSIQGGGSSKLLSKLLCFTRTLSYSALCASILCTVNFVT